MKLECSYDKFARFYDEYMQHVDYESWVNFVLNQYNQHHTRGAENILELACGTGNIANRLVQRGYKVIGTDKSTEMIRIARSKPFPAEFFVRDMLDEIEPDKFDLILLLFDSLNYLSPISEISSLFENIYCALKPDALFIFDISTEKNCLDNFHGFVNIEDRKDCFIIHRSEYHHEDRLQKTHFTLFEKDLDSYTRFDEIHRQKIYPATDIIKTLEKSSLKLQGIYRLLNSEQDKLSQEEMATADKCFHRIFFVCGK